MISHNIGNQVRGQIRQSFRGQQLGIDICIFQTDVRITGVLKGRAIDVSSGVVNARQVNI